jgi:hypothetical protein
VEWLSIQQQVSIRQFNYFRNPSQLIVKEYGFAFNQQFRISVLQVQATEYNFEFYAAQFLLKTGFEKL